MRGMAEGNSKTALKVLAGCSIGCLGLSFCICAFTAFMFSTISTSMKALPPYQESLTIIRGTPEVMNAFGGAIEPGTFVTGSFNVSGSEGDAQLSYPVTGPGGSGRVSIRAVKLAGVWEFQALVITKTETAERWDLTP